MADFEAVLSAPPGLPVEGAIHFPGAWGHLYTLSELEREGKKIKVLVVKTLGDLRHFTKHGWRTVSVTHASEGGFVG